MTRDLSKALQRVANCWLNPQDPLRQEALRSAAPEFCLSPASFSLALDWIFSLWTPEKIAEVVAANPFKTCRSAVQVLAGTTPAMIAQGFFQGTILNIPQALKIPRQQPRFAELLLQSFREEAEPYASLFELFSQSAELPEFYTALRGAELVIAYGNNETLANLRRYLAAGAIFRGRGHAESAALILKEAATEQQLENLAYDLLSYDQRGCLSPRVTFVEQGGKLSPAACAQFFAEEVLPPLAKRFPRGGLFAGEAAALLHQRNLSGFLGKVYCGEDWTVSYTEKLLWPERALPRFMPFIPFTSPTELKTIFESRKDRLLCLGVGGAKNRQQTFIHSFAPKICALGVMQRQLLVF